MMISYTNIKFVLFNVTTKTHTDLLIIGHHKYIH